MTTCIRCLNGQLLEDGYELGNKKPTLVCLQCGYRPATSPPIDVALHPPTRHRERKPKALRAEAMEMTP